MGNQNCCDDRTIQNEITLDPVTTQTGKRTDLSLQTSQALSPQAEDTFNKLKQQHGNNEFLDLQSQRILNPSLEERLSFQKLPNLNAFYCGQWNNTQPQGRGKVIFPNGSLLIGIFKSNACNYKQCYFIFKDGSHYFGSVMSNTLSGRGKFISPKMTYQGEWVHGKPHGEGMQVYQNGDKFIGTFKDGKKEGYNCTFRWQDHQKYLEYSGEFIQNKISGKGKLTFKKGTVVEGIFDQETILNAKCSSSKFQCSCSFVKGLLQGKGKLNLNKDQYEGQFKDGQLYGKCVHIDAKSRRNEVFAFKGRELKEVKGLSDQEIDHIIAIIDKVYNKGQTHTDALKKINHTFNREYEAKLIEPFETIFNDRKYLIIQTDDQTIYVKSNQK